MAQLTYRRRRIRPETRHVYLARSDDAPQLVKIGISGDLPARMRELRCVAVATIERPYREAAELERDLHARFAADRVAGEWFWYTPAIRAVVDELEGEWHR